jgi:hypothetical protein
MLLFCFVCTRRLEVVYSYETFSCHRTTLKFDSFNCVESRYVGIILGIRLFANSQIICAFGLLENWLDRKYWVEQMHRRDNVFHCDLYIVRDEVGQPGNGIRIRQNPYEKYTCNNPHVKHMWFTCGIGTITYDSHMIHI